MKCSVRLGAFAAALVAISAVPARAEFVTINGQVVIPYDSFREDDEGSAQDTKAGLLSAGGQVLARAQRALQSGNGVIVGPSIGGQSLHGQGNGHDDEATRNTQVNDPALDSVQIIPGFFPFEFGTESETSMVSRGRDIVVGYNTSAGSHLTLFPDGLFFTQLLLSGYSVSHDGGKTWKSGFVPGISPQLPFTFGDPSVAMDRRGNIFYTSLGIDAAFNGALIINKSSDSGDTWSPATVIVTDNGSDKEWLAIGADPKNPSRDNLYVTWTSYYNGGNTLNFARSIDGGNTWTKKVLFAPAGDANNSSFIQFSNPVVDPLNGRLYVPFLHFSTTNADNVRMLVSDDGGDTFSFVAFNSPGAIDAFALPNVTPGVLNDCTSSGFREVLKQGSSTFPPQQGFIFSYERVTRLISQPSTAVFGGNVFIALNSSTSPNLWDPTAGSQIRVIFSRDGGKTWADPLVAAPSTSADPQHVHPSIAVANFGASAVVGYYVQQKNEKLRTELATLKVTGNHLKVQDRSPLSSVAFDLTPSNVHLSSNPADDTINWDSTIVQCYDIGEYMSVNTSSFWDADSRASAAWGDNRRSWTPPPGSLVPGVHPQADVFFGRADQ